MKLYGLIGYPLEHSFSKSYFLEKFKKDNITDTDYQNFPLSSIDELFFLLNVNRDLLGLNVTSPYKQQVIGFLSEIDDDAKQINAVNAVKIEREGSRVILKGYNTDVYGFLTSLESLNLTEINSALIAGTGGAAQAVAFALKKLNIKSQFISGSQSGKGVISYDDLDDETVKKNKLIINATPLGMFPDVDKKPDIPYEAISDSHVLYDLIYNPEITKFLEEGKTRGATIMNGLKMLEFQAEKAWEIFNSVNSL